MSAPDEQEAAADAAEAPATPREQAFEEALGAAAEPAGAGASAAAEEAEEPDSEAEEDQADQNAAQSELALAELSEDDKKWEAIKVGCKQLWDFVLEKPWECYYDMLLGFGFMCPGYLVGVTKEQFVRDYRMGDNPVVAGWLADAIQDEIANNPEHLSFAAEHPNLIADFHSCWKGKQLLKFEPDFFRYLRDFQEESKGTPEEMAAPEWDKRWSVPAEDKKLYNREGKWMACAGCDLKVFLWPVDHPSFSPPIVRAIDVHIDVVTALQMDWERMMAVTCGADAIVKITDLETGEPVLKITDPVYRAEIADKSAFSVDADLEVKKAVIGTNVPSCKLLDLEAGKHVCSLRGHTDHVIGVKADWDLNMVVSASWDGWTHIYDIRTPRIPVRKFKHHDCTIAYRLHVDFEQMLALTTGLDYDFKLHDLTKGQTIRTYPLDIKSDDIKVDWKSMRVCTGSHTGIAQTWDLESGQCTSSFDTEEGIITALDVLWDEDLAVLAHWSGRIHLRRLSTWELLKDYKKARRMINDIWLKPS